MKLTNQVTAYKDNQGKLWNTQVEASASNVEAFRSDIAEKIAHVIYTDVFGTSYHEDMDIYTGLGSRPNVHVKFDRIGVLARHLANASTVVRLKSPARQEVVDLLNEVVNMESCMKKELSE